MSCGCLGQRERTLLGFGSFASCALGEGERARVFPLLGERESGAGGSETALKEAAPASCWQFSVSTRGVT